MKIKVERDKLVKAVKELEGIEIVVENVEDAKEAIDLILRKTELSQSDQYQKLKGIEVNSMQEYTTSAVDYTLVFLLEFLFEEDINMDAKVALIRELQEFFEKF